MGCQTGFIIHRVHTDLDLYVFISCAYNLLGVTGLPYCVADNKLYGNPYNTKNMWYLQTVIKLVKTLAKGQPLTSEGSQNKKHIAAATLVTIFPHNSSCFIFAMILLQMFAEAIKMQLSLHIKLLYA